MRRARVGLASVLALVVTAGVGCGRPNSELKLESVAPQQIPYGVQTSVKLKGSFMPRLAISLGESSSTSLDEQFEVEVGSVQASEVHFLGPDELEIVIPRGLELGTQRVVVTDPRGEQARLEEGLNVVISEPEQIAFAQPLGTALLGRWTSPIRVDFLDANGLPSRTVKSQTAVRVTTDSPTGQLSLDISGAQPSLQLLLPAGVEGFDFVYLDDSPGFHTLTVAAEGLPPISQTVMVGQRGEPARVRFVVPQNLSVQAGEPVALGVEVEDVTGATVVPSRPIDVSLAVMTASAGLALGQEGPFGTALNVRVGDAGSRSTFYFRGTRAQPGVAVVGSAMLPDSTDSLMPDSTSIPVAPAPPAGFEVLRLSANNLSVLSPHVDAGATDASACAPSLACP